MVDRKIQMNQTHLKENMRYVQPSERDSIDVFAFWVRLEDRATSKTRNKLVFLAAVIKSTHTAQRRLHGTPSPETNKCQCYFIYIYALFASMASQGSLCLLERALDVQLELG